MNYYAIKAYLTAQELDEITRKLAIAARRKDYKALDKLLFQQDNLASELKELDIQARARLIN